MWKFIQGSDEEQQDNLPEETEGLCSLSLLYRVFMGSPLVCSRGLFSLIVFAKPIKFALLFTFGNMLAVGSTAFLIGPGQQLRMMLDPVRVYATAIYVGCVVLALVCALLIHSKILTIIAIICEICALIWLQARPCWPAANFCVLNYKLTINTTIWAIAVSWSGWLLALFNMATSHLVLSPACNISSVNPYLEEKTGGLTRCVSLLSFTWTILNAINLLKAVPLVLLLCSIYDLCTRFVDSIVILFFAFKFVGLCGWWRYIRKI
ncbi:Vesicle transport protein SFT2B [Sesamum angolense]|uniref:Vesicle transport protein n=1 Tax=Sesamum angolense TaxID=2727404 RepID=A0AAE1TBJ6_9LAMI|nr:Vesicle transport protein SFT2B [Sesamum angolense]